MKIGIDIDDTLSNIKEQINIQAFNYALKLNKSVSFYNGKIFNYENLYRNIYKLDDNEIKYFISNIHEEITNMAVPREGAIEVIQKLKNESHQIYIITSRSFKYHNDPYMLSKKWLDKNGIKYDKLIVNADNKLDICKNENIDIFIDDLVKNCVLLKDNGIYAININDYDEKNNEIFYADNWYKIYEIIYQLSEERRN